MSTSSEPAAPSRLPAWPVGQPRRGHNGPCPRCKPGAAKLTGEQRGGRALDNQAVTAIPAHLGGDHDLPGPEVAVERATDTGHRQFPERLPRDFGGAPCGPPRAETSPGDPHGAARSKASQAMPDRTCFDPQGCAHEQGALQRAVLRRAHLIASLSGVHRGRLGALAAEWMASPRPGQWLIPRISFSASHMP